MKRNILFNVGDESFLLVPGNKVGVTFEVLTEMTTQTAVCWGVGPRSFVDRYYCFLLILVAM
jgi:hypothetical protein